MPYLDRDGFRLYYEADGEGLPLLFIHGFAASSAMFAPQIPALSERHRTIAWDMRGHGASDYPDDPAEYSTPHVMGDLSALLDANDADRGVVIGHSVGGYLALRFALLHPDRVAALVVFDCAPGYRRDDRRQEWNDYCERRAQGYEEKGLSTNPSSDEVRAAEHRDATGLAHAARGILTQEDALVIDSLPDLDKPTLALAGRHDIHDGYDFVSPIEYMAKKIPQAELTIFEHSGHAPCLTEPDAFNARVLQFLDRVNP